MAVDNDERKKVVRVLAPLLAPCALDQLFQPLELSGDPDADLKLRLIPGLVGTLRKDAKGDGGGDEWVVQCLIDRKALWVGFEYNVAHAFQVVVSVEA